MQLAVLERNMCMHVCIYIYIYIYIIFPLSVLFPRSVLLCHCRRSCQELHAILLVIYFHFLEMSGVIITILLQLALYLQS